MSALANGVILGGMFTLRRRQSLFAAALLGGLFSAPLLLASSPQDSARPLVPGKALQVQHDLASPSPMFRIEVPDYVTSLHIWTESANADVSMLVGFEERPDPLKDEYALASLDTWIDEDLWIHITDSYSLSPGTWFVTLPVYGFTGEEDAEGMVRYSLHCEFVSPKRVPLLLGQPVTLQLSRDQGLMAAFNCEVSPDLVRAGTRLRLEVVSNDADVDVVAGPQPAGSTYWEQFARGDSDLGYEQVHFGADESGRRFGVLAYALPELESFQEIQMTVLLTLDTPASPSLKPSPRIASLDSDSPLERALNATVGVFGPLGAGSGVVISPDGYVLTNAHVVSGALDDGTGLPPLAIAFDLDRISSAVPTLGARIVEYRQDLDLALLKIDSDLGNSPLPDDLRFPFLPVRPPQDLPQIGDDLWCVGFPMTGGSNSFVTLTATRGVLSGFSQELEGLQFKVDAQIHSGMSGGACIDTLGRLLGLPSASLTDTNQAGGLGYVIPVASVPEAWWVAIEEQR